MQKTPGPAQIHVSHDLEALSAEAAGRFAGAVSAAVAARGSAAVALAGGKTPSRMYELLSAPPYRDGVPWSELHVLWSDERAVDPTDPRSNYRLAHETLLAHVPVRHEHIHRMPAEAQDLQSAARTYARILALHALAGAGGWPALDLVLLGLGNDGHTASLFPGDPALAEARAAVAAVETPHQGTRRLTLTLPVLGAAARIVFLVAGGDKAEMVRRVLVDRNQKLPAARVRPAGGELTWLLDAAAAHQLAHPDG
jgi:6-phosphogluconolactonase